MYAQELETEPFELPTINPWRQAPTRTQIQYATDLCRSELAYAERTATIATFEVLDRQEMSTLIDTLRGLRERRLARLRRAKRRRR